MTDLLDPVEVSPLMRLYEAISRGGVMDEIALDVLRDSRDCMAALLPQIEGMLRVVDEAELAEARARVAEIEKRLEASGSLIYVEATADGEVIRHASKASLPVSDYDQTDAGMGIGGGREPAQSADDFRDELAELREHGVEKRRKRGI